MKVINPIEFLWFEWSETVHFWNKNKCFVIEIGIGRQMRSDE